MAGGTKTKPAARNTGRNKQTVNGIMNKLKDGRGVKISTILKILDDCILFSKFLIFSCNNILFF